MPSAPRSRISGFRCRFILWPVADRTAVGSLLLLRRLLPIIELHHAGNNQHPGGLGKYSGGSTAFGAFLHLEQEFRQLYRDGRW